MKDTKEIKERKYQNVNLLQICSPVFPTGGFNHSFGLETYINKNLVKNASQLIQILKVYLQTQFLFNDALGIKLVYEHLNQHEKEFCVELDNLLHVSTLPRETREGYSKIGIRSVECLVDILPDSENLNYYAEAVKAKKAHGNSIVAYAIAFHELNVELSVAIESFVYMNISNMIQNAIRAIPLGPTDGIYVGNQIKPFVLEVIEKVKRLTINDIGVNGFQLEISQMNHEDSLIRLFMS